MANFINVSGDSECNVAHFIDISGDSECNVANLH